METDTIRTEPYEPGNIDFKLLADKDADFQKIWLKSNKQLDFEDPETVRALTKAFLKVDFQLQIDLPDNRLCPPVPNRWSYVTWIQALVDSTSPAYSRGYDPERKVTGLDIGTGASAIYALLCLKTRPNWSMCVTDVDKHSFDYAARNLALNNMLSRTKMLQSTQLLELVPLKFLAVESLDFIMCNPPFFDNDVEMRSSLMGEGKSLRPNSVCTGSESEMVTPGGDFGFVSKLVKESLVLRDKVTWYSSLMGKMDSAKAIIDLLKKNGVNNWAVHCLDTGAVTKRWVVAWSFGDLRPSNHIARGEPIAHEYLPFPTLYTISDTDDITQAADKIISTLSGLDMIQWDWSPETNMGVGEAHQNVWCRRYRRERARMMKTGEPSSAAVEVQKMDSPFAFRIRVDEGPAKAVLIEWLRGVHVVVWESFCGFMHAKLRHKP